MVERFINPLKTYSFFLFGARGTGKSTFLRNYFPHDETVLWIDLLNPEEENRYARNPLELAANLDAVPGKTKWVVLKGVHGGAQSNFGVGVGVGIGIGFCVSERMMSLQNPTPIPTPIYVEFVPQPALCGAGQSHVFYA
jgi:hypothetical protein